MGKLFDKVCTVDTLHRAWREIERKGAQGGIDGVSVAEFARDADRHLQDLAASLHEGRYSPEPADRIKVPKFNEARELRPLSLPAVKDKVVQQAVRLVIEPLFEAQFLGCSYAYRPGRGPRKAIGKVIYYICTEKREWAVFGDMDNFFDSLDHELLLAEVRKTVSEPEILALVRMWIKIGAMDQRGRYHDMELGVTQGGIISPLLSNIYAHSLDRHLVGMNMAYVRYADNFIVLCPSREEADRSLAAVREFLEGTLRMRLNPEKEPVRNLREGFVFLGVEFRGRERFLAREKKEKLRRKIDWLTEKRRRHDSGKIIQELAEAIDGARRYYGFLNPVSDFRELDRYLLHRLKVLMITRRERGAFKTRNELSLLLAKLPFFAATDEKAGAALRKELLQRVFERPPAQTSQKPNSLRSLKGLASDPSQPAVSVPHVAPELPWEDKPNGAPPAPKDQQGNGQTPSAVTGTPPQPEPPREDAGSRGSAPEAVTAQAADRKIAVKKQRYVRQGFVTSEIIIQTPGTFVGHRGNRVVMYRDRKKVEDQPMQKVKSILIESVGVTVSSDLIKACATSDVPIVFSSPKGRSYASVHAPLQSKPDLSLLQLEAVRNGTALNWAKAFVYGKLKNQLNLLKFYLRHREDEDPVYTNKMQEAEPQLKAIQQKVKAMKVELPYEDLRNQLFGYEGQAGAIYWDMVRLLVPKETGFAGRVTQGARDLVNSSLNYGYSLLYPRMERALLMAGLNLYVSLLHAPQVGKPTLSFDLIETFRAPVVDRAVFSLLTRGRELQLTKAGFLNESSRQLVTQAIVGRLGTLVPYRGEKIVLDEVIYKQARLLTRSLREGKRYAPFISRY